MNDNMNDNWKFKRDGRWGKNSGNINRSSSNWSSKKKIGVMIGVLIIGAKLQ